VLISNSPYKTRCWALYLNGLQCMLEIGIGISTQIVPGPTIAANTWTHIAVSVERSPASGRWYLNGAPAGAFNFVPTPGPISSNADLYLGQASPPFGTAPLLGCIDELELFDTPLQAATVAQVYAAGTIGKCPEYCRMPTVTTICKDQTSVQVCFNICNNQPTPQSYHWSLAGQPVGSCSVNGPVTFTPPAGAVTVGAGSCSLPICVTIPRPSGLTVPNATSCYTLTFVNDATGATYSCNGTIRADYSCWCFTPPSGITTVAARVMPGSLGTPIVIGAGNPCDHASTLSYRLIPVFTSTDQEDPLELSLNGLPPGEPVIGDLSYGPNETGEVTVYASYPDGYDAFGHYEIKLEADMDGDGVLEIITGARVASSYDSLEQVLATPPPTRLFDSIRLLATPNPFFGGSRIEFTLAREDRVDLAVYDLGGRRLRTLKHGALAAGPQRFDWNGRDDAGHVAPAGVYFVKLETERIELRTKVVKLR
jgi:hypothetical protein